jgi:hypothetical protein
LFKHGQLRNRGCSFPKTAVSAAQIERGYQQLIRLAHTHHLKIFGGALTPYRGFHLYWTPAGEAEREAVNRWTRTSHPFDGVIDFAKALQDPQRPRYLNPAFNGGDYLPNDAGGKAMAAAIKLALPK